MPFVAHHSMENSQLTFQPNLIITVPPLRWFKARVLHHYASCGWEPLLSYQVIIHIPPTHPYSVVSALKIFLNFILSIINSMHALIHVSLNNFTVCTHLSFYRSEKPRHSEVK